MVIKQTSTHSSQHRPPSYLFFSIVALSFLSLLAILAYKVDNFVSQTKTVVGHNLEPTPWHIFPRKNFTDEARPTFAYKIIQCSYLTCRYVSSSVADDGDQPPEWNPADEDRGLAPSRSTTSQAPKCPNFFKFIYRDLEPWFESKISMDHINQAKENAAFRVVIVEGKLFVEFYYQCVQSRLMFTIWGILQLMKKYPGMIPDVDIMFDCMDRPTVKKSRIEIGALPLPLFRYCSTEAHFDIPFPDWSFWGWPEVNVPPWDEQFREIKLGSQAQSWKDKINLAYWKGNPDVLSPVREELTLCNDTYLWGTEIIRQNWSAEARAGFHLSKLANQCNHRYKIYAEGYAWSVSLKYILSCGSLPLLISPEYEDFFTRGLIPKLNYWPVSKTDICGNIKVAVDWGNKNPSQAEAVGQRAQQLMETLTMDRVYDYMFHLITQYAKLQDFKPVPPPSSQQVCEESILCFADEKQKEYLRKSAVTKPSSTPPCALVKRPDPNFFKSWAEQKKIILDMVKDMEVEADAAVT